MQKCQEQIWVDELKSDFPGHVEEIDLLSHEIELFLELAEDYHHCKHQISMLEKSNKLELLLKYKDTFQDLKEEIQTELTKKRSFHKNM